jgi:hypothetical protein
MKREPYHYLHPNFIAAVQNAVDEDPLFHRSGILCLIAGDVCRSAPGDAAGHVICIRAVSRNLRRIADAINYAGPIVGELVENR